MRTAVAAAIAAALAAVGVAALADGKGPPPPEDDPPAVRTVVAQGVALTRVGTVRPKRQRAIARAVVEARLSGFPRAVAAARAEAAGLARAAGVELGPVIGVSRADPPGYFYEDGGTFGPGRYCGTYSRAILGPRGPDGHRHVVRRVRRHSCRVPRDAVASVTVTVATR
jgi:hypothetical protein